MKKPKSQNEQLNIETEESKQYFKVISVYS